MSLFFVYRRMAGRMEAANERNFCQERTSFSEMAAFACLEYTKKDEFFNSSFMHNLKRIIYPFHPEKVLF
jgi:hypothetical protein